MTKIAFPLRVLDVMDSFATRCVVAFVACCVLCANANADPISQISAIQEIQNGHTLTFQPVDEYPPEVFKYDMLFSGSYFLTHFTDEVTGNAAAPLSEEIIELKVPGTENPGFVRIQTTGLPWTAIGASFGSSSLITSPSLSLTGYDKDGNLLGQLTRTFENPQTGFPGFNSAAFFLGMSSTTPIYSVQFAAIGSPGGIDNLTFLAVPEPASCAMAFVAGAWVLGVGRRQRLRRRWLV